MRKILILLALAACTNTAEPTVSPVGSYALVSLDNVPLPAQGVVASSLTIKSDGSFAWTETDATAAKNIAGRWAISGSTLTLIAPTTQYTAIADGQVILFASSAQWRWRFERQ